MYVMVNGLVPRATQADKTGVSDDTLEPIIYRPIKLQNLSVVLNRLQTFAILLKKYNNINRMEFI